MLFLKIIKQIALLFLPVALFAQASNQHHADSLVALAKNYAKADSLKALYLIDAGAILIGTDNNRSISLTEEGLALSEKIDWKRGIVSAYRQLGAVYQSKSNLIKAIEFTQKAIVFGKLLANANLDGSLYLNLGLMYISLKDFEKGFTHINKAMAFYKKIDDKEGIAITALNLGIAFLDSKTKMDSSIYYSNQSYLYGLATNNETIMAYSLGNMGLAYNKKGMPDSGIIALVKCGELGKKLGNQTVIIMAMVGRAEANKALNQYANAEAILLAAIAIQKEKGIIQYQGESYNMLSEIYKVMAKPAKALEAFENFVLLRDSILNDEKKQEVVRLEEKFEYDKKEAVLTATHAAKIKQQRTAQYALAGSSVILITSGIFSFMLYKRKKEAKILEKEAELQKEIAEQKMKALRSQMNPHFIFNALNSIADYMRKNDIPNADYYLTKFARLMRLVLENSEKKEVTLADDLQALELYMQMEAMRSNNKFDYEIIIEDSINADETYLPPLLLQPYVENSIWHGISPKESKGKIIVRVSKDGDEMLNCMVEDNGVGRKQISPTSNLNMEDVTPKKSMGMGITNERIKLLNKEKATNGGIIITDLSPGLRVLVKLPFEMG